MADSEGGERAEEDREEDAEEDGAEDPFIHNVIEGNIGRVRKLLGAGADVNSVNQFPCNSEERRAVDKQQVDPVKFPTIPSITIPVKQPC